MNRNLKGLIVMIRYYNWQETRKFEYYAVPKDRINWLSKNGYITWNANTDWWDAVCYPSQLEGERIYDYVD